MKYQTYIGNLYYTDFQFNKLKSKLLSKHPDLNGEFFTASCFYLVNAPQITQEQELKLMGLLEAQKSVENQEEVFFNLPQKNVETQWSTKVKGILKELKIDTVLHIEKGICFQGLDLKQLNQQAKNLLYDQMTQQLVDNDLELSDWFAKSKPEGLDYYDIMSGGVQEIRHANESLGLAMDDEELVVIFRTYFQKYKRNPTDLELMMIGQINSEHCRHKIFNAKVFNENKEFLPSLFALIKQTYQKSPQGIVLAYKDNSAIFAQDDIVNLTKNSQGKYLKQEQSIHFIAKAETHNHPSAISPNAGAATGVGGEIRDEAATGIGSKTRMGFSGFTLSNLHIPDFIQSWEKASLEFGVGNHYPENISNSLDILIEAPIGGAHYGNEFGRPQLLGYFRTLQFNLPHLQNSSIGYHKPIMMIGGMGIIYSEHSFKNKLEAGDLLIVLGGPSYKIGIAGGSSSSVLSGENRSHLDFNSVQRDNAEMERVCQEVINKCTYLKTNNPILAIHDVGAGGLSNALTELVYDGGVGAIIDLEKLPKADTSLSPMELWCNESQERYVLAIKKENQSFFEQICQQENCPVSIVGIANSSKELELKLANEQKIDIETSDLFENFPQKSFNFNQKLEYKEKDWLPSSDLEKMIDDLLALPAIAAKNFLITIADRSISGLVVKDQFVGAYQIPINDYGLMACDHLGYTGQAFSLGERPNGAIINPEKSVKLAIAESITNLLPAGINNLSDIILSANWMASCADSNQKMRLYSAVKATSDFCQQLGVCIPVGKDSLSMESKWQQDNLQKKVSSPVSLVVSAFSKVENVRNRLSAQLNPSENKKLYLLNIATNQGLGGSCLSQIFNNPDYGIVPDVEAKDLRKLFDFIKCAMEQNWLDAYHDVSDGGVFVSLLEMAFTTQLGLKITLNTNDYWGNLFSEGTAVVLQIDDDCLELVQNELQELGLLTNFFCIAQIQSNKQIELYVQEKLLYQKSLLELEKRWRQTSFEVQKLRDNPNCAQQEFDLIGNEYSIKERIDFKIKPENFLIKKPIKAAIFRERGVNGHEDMASAFLKAGFETYDVNMQSLKEGEVSLSDFHLGVFCGGFSYGDVLGAGKGWANSILANEKTQQEFRNFFHRTDTLTLGVCNGCQMLAYLSELMPYHSDEIFPHFHQNESAQFEARLALVKILESNSVFLQGMQESILAVPLAHGEGRVMKTTAHSQKIMEYVDHLGQASMTYPINPNGSINATAGLTSSDGRVTVMMPHPERYIRNINKTFLSHNELKQYSQDDSAWMRMFYNVSNYYK